MKLEVRFYLTDAPDAIRGAEISVDVGDNIEMIMKKCLLIENCGFKKEDLNGSTFLLDGKAVELSYTLKGHEQKLFFLNPLIGG